MPTPTYTLQQHVAQPVLGNTQVLVNTFAAFSPQQLSPRHTSLSCICSQPTQFVGAGATPIGLAQQQVSLSLSPCCFHRLLLNAEPGAEPCGFPQPIYTQPIYSSAPVISNLQTPSVLMQPQLLNQQQPIMVSGSVSLPIAYDDLRAQSGFQQPTFQGMRTAVIQPIAP